MARIQATAGIGSALWSADSTSIDAGDGVTCLASADPERHSVTIINDAASASDVWLTPSSTRKTGGFRLSPGAALELRTVAPVYGYVVAGSATAYAVSESGVPC